MARKKLYRNDCLEGRVFQMADVPILETKGWLSRRKFFGRGGVLDTLDRPLNDEEISALRFQVRELIDEVKEHELSEVYYKSLLSQQGDNK